MGYCYCAGKLVCDGCGKTGGVVKRKCPFGYCPPPALCKGCFTDPKNKAEWDAYHVEHHCEEHAKYVRETLGHRIVRGGV